MIKVEKTAKTLDEGIKNLMAGAKLDYERMSTRNGQKELTGYSKEQVDKWNKKALEDDNNFIAEQDKLETSEAAETPANQ